MINQLTRLDDFKQILSDYHISDTGKKLLVSTRLALLVGPTSAGRNTIINALKETGHYHQIISDTTRKPRENNGVLEQDGVEYWFRDESDVLADLRAGKFLEAAIIHNQQVSGMSLREIERAKKEQKVAVNEIEIVGMQNIINAKPDVFALFVVPPTFDVWMKRMDGRGVLPMPEKIRRLQSAVQEFEAALTKDYYIYIVNEEFNHSVERIHTRILENRHDPAHQAIGREVIERLLVETQAYLNKHSSNKV
jgi:guanylate kinase